MGADRLARATRIAEEAPDAVIAIVGPTGSGKTALAVDLAEAIGGEIVSADSVQIYRYFDIGSGKPSAEELARAPHHALSIVDPLDAVDAARFAGIANAAIESIRARGRRVIVCGGTFLWLKALLFGLADAPGADDAIRAKHRHVVEREGRPALHAALAVVDPESASRLHPNDFVRVSRALEVFELTGRKLSDWQRAHAFKERKHDARLIGIAHTPEQLTLRIEARVRQMLDDGWIAETRSLVDRGYSGARAMGAVGYREVKMHLDGALAEEDLHASIVRATRVFARRQRTWVHHVDVTWL